MRRLIVGTMGLLAIIAVAAGLLMETTGLLGQGSDPVRTTIWGSPASYQTVDQPSGTSARAGIRGIVRFEVRDGNGKLKENGIVYNTVNVEGLNDAFLLIASAGSGAYDGIAHAKFNGLI